MHFIDTSFSLLYSRVPLADCCAGPSLVLFVGLLEKAELYLVVGQRRWAPSPP